MRAPTAMTKLFAALVWLLALAAPAQAHLLPKQNATMNIVDASAFFVVSVPVSALNGVDDDGDGALSATEIQNHTAAIQAQFAARFHVTNNGQAGNSVLTWVLPPQTDGEVTASDYVVVMQRVNFVEVPQTPVLETSLFGSKPGETQMTITATRGSTKEVAILESATPSHKFFRGAFAIFADYLRIGIEHILTGADHLLFLLTILIAGAGWRYWFGVVTSFTIAHSITLSLAALNILRIPAALVEPGIAASIVLMALLNLRRAQPAGTHQQWPIVATVFACGLLHGFGFASAIGVMAIDTTTRIVTLGGFNLGIETGQFIFVGTALLLATACRQLGFFRLAKLLPTVAQLTAVALGLLWFSQRVDIFA